jgi:hypothetical protein
VGAARKRRIIGERTGLAVLLERNLGIGQRSTSDRVTDIQRREAELQPGRVLLAPEAGGQDRMNGVELDLDAHSRVIRADLDRRDPRESADLTWITATIAILIDIGHHPVRSARQIGEDEPSRAIDREAALAAAREQREANGRLHPDGAITRNPAAKDHSPGQRPAVALALRAAGRQARKKQERSHEPRHDGILPWRATFLRC